MVAATKSLIALLPALLFMACSDTPTEALNSDAIISLDTTGGFAGVDFAVLVDGPAGEVIGTRCVSFCDWEDGDVLAAVTPEAMRELEQKFDSIDFLAGDDEDFGEECCDQFLYQLKFERLDQSRMVMGSSERLPAAILALIVDVEEWVAETRADEQ